MLVRGNQFQRYCFFLFHFAAALGRMPGDSCESIGEEEEEEEEEEDSNENEGTSAEDDQSPEGRVRQQQQ